MPTGLGYDFLRPVEDFRGSNLKHYYFMADWATAGAGQNSIASGFFTTDQAHSGLAKDHQTVVSAVTRFECGCSPW